MKVGMLIDSTLIDSLKAVFGGVDQALQGRHEIFYRPPEFLRASKERQLEITKELILNCDVALGPTDEIFLEARERAGKHIPYIWFMLGNMPRGVPHLFGNWHYLKTTDIFVGNCTGDIEIGHRFFENARMWLLPFAFDHSKFFPMDEGTRQLLRSKMGFSPDDKVLFYSGRVMLEKNIHTLLKIFSMVQTVVPRVHLVVAGQGSEKPFMEFGVFPVSIKNTLVKIIDKLNIDQKQVLFVGHKPAAELRGLYNIADAMVNLTLYHDENFGLAQIEAMACGTPVIGSEWGGLKDTIVDGETGYKIDTTVTSHGIKLDWWDATCKIISLLKDDALRLRFRQKSGERALEKYTLAQYGQQIESMLAACEANKRAGGPIQISKFGQEFWHVCAPRSGELPSYRKGHRAYRLYTELITPYASKSVTAATLGQLSGNDTLCLAVPVTLNNGILETEDIIFPFRIVIPERLQKDVGAILDAFRKEPVTTVAQLISLHLLPDEQRVKELLVWMLESGILLKTGCRSEQAPREVAARMSTPLLSIQYVDHKVDVVTLS